MSGGKVRILVWDRLVRWFHLLYLVGFASAFVIAKLIGEDSAVFPYHMMVGLSLAFIVILRLIWGLIGTRWARLTALSLHPRALFAYFRQVLSREPESSVGHNPATSFTMLAMFAVTLGLAWTGYRMTVGDYSGKQIHELLVNVWLALVIAHVLGVVLQTVRKRSRIALSMVDGTKLGDPNDAIPNRAAFPALVFVLLTAYFFGSMAWRFSPSTQTTAWPFTGAKLVLGEGDSEREEGEEGEDR